MKYIFFSLIFILLSNSICTAQIPFREVDKWGLVDHVTLDFISEIKYDEIYPRNIFSVLLNYRIGDKLGCLNYQGEEVLPAIYDEISPFYYEVAKVRIGDKTFIIDEKGNKVLDQAYKVHAWAGSDEEEETSEPDFTDYKLVAFPEKKWGDILQKAEPDSVWTFNKTKRFNPYLKNGKWGVISSFKYDTGPVYDTVFYFGKSTLCLQKDNKVGLLISKLGGQTPQLFFDDFDEITIEEKHNNSYTYFFRKGELWGYLGDRGELVEPKYKSIAFSKNNYDLLEVVTKNGKKGFIDYRRGKELFSEEKLKTKEELNQIFAPINKSASDLIHKLVGKKFKNFEKKVDHIFQKNAEIESRSVEALMREFSKQPYAIRNKFDKKDIIEIADWMLENQIIILEKPNCHPALNTAFDSLYKENRALVLQEYRYGTSVLSEIFKSKMINAISPGLINMSLGNFNEQSDFQNPLHKKVFLLFHFYNAMYYDLVDRGKIQKPTSR